MLGIPLFRATPGVSPIEFDYELRCLKYVEWNGEWIIAGGDKSGKLIVFKYDGKRVKHICRKKFQYKIVSMDFIIYGENEDQLGLMAALEVEDQANIFFHPRVLQARENSPGYRAAGHEEDGWQKIQHNFGTPRLIYKPFITPRLSGILLSFRDRSFLMTNLIPGDDSSYCLEVIQKRRFTSCIIDACSEFPKNIEETREQNKLETRYIYLASKGGCVLRMVFDFDPIGKGRYRFFIERLRTVHNSIRSIKPLTKIAGAAYNFRGIIGIAGTDFFCLYRDKEIPPTDSMDLKKHYRLLMEHFPNSLQNLETGTFPSPERDGAKHNLILVADSGGTLHCRQFESNLTATNLPEFITARRWIFRDKIEDRIFGIVPVTVRSPHRETGTPLMQLALGLGSHEIIFRDLVDKNPVIGEIQKELSGGNIKENEENSSLEKQARQYIDEARAKENDPRQTHQLMTALFDPPDRDDSLALKLLQKEHTDLFVQLIYWLLSSSRKAVFQQIYKKICELIQYFNRWITTYYSLEDEKEEHRRIYNELDQLLTDIDKFWIGGETYSGKLADLYRLIDINNINRKPLDVLIYKASLNDRGLAVENRRKICSSEINTLAQYKDIILAADLQGYLYILENRRGFQQLCAPVNVREIGHVIFGRNYKSHQSQTNYIRQIFFLHYAGLGLLLMQDGGLWVFSLELLDNREHLDARALFDSPGSRIFCEGISVHSIKYNPYDFQYYLCDRLGLIYSLKGLKHKLQNNIKLSPVNSAHDTRTVSDFEFFPGNRIAMTDVSGNIALWNIKSPGSEKIYTFPSHPRFSRCFVWKNHILIVGTEEGDVCAFEEKSNHLVCRWTYRLPGAIRYIQPTEDDSVLVGGLCPRSVVIKPGSGEIEDCIRLHPLHDMQEKPRESITMLQVLTPDAQESIKRQTGQRLLFIAGDQQGHLKTYRIYHAKLFEEDIEQFFNDDAISLTAKTQVRCINVHEHSLRRLFTAFDSRSWDLDRVSNELNRMALARGYSLYAGPMVHLIRSYADLFMRRFRNKDAKNDAPELKKTYLQFQETVRTIIRHFGLKNNYYCQLVLKTLGARLLSLMTHRNFMSALNRVSGQDSIPRLRNLRQLIAELHVQCDEATLVHVYEELRSMLRQRRDHGYTEEVVDFICERLRGHEFEPHMPNPLLLKMVDVLALLVDKRFYCPIKLCYMVLREDVNINVISYLQAKVENKNCRKVFAAAYRLSELLSEFDEIDGVLEEINQFPELFPQKFGDDIDSFYREFMFVFKLGRSILEYSDAMTLATSTVMETYEHDTHWFKVMIHFFNQVIVQIGKMKNVFQQCLSFQWTKPVPMETLNGLRAYFKYLVETDSRELKMGDIYYRLFFTITSHLEKILTDFCETTLPIQTLEQTANSLDSYLEEIRNQQKPLPALDNPDTLVIYNRYFKNMFDTLIVGMQPHKAYFNYPQIENYKKKKYLNIYNFKGEYLLRQLESTRNRDIDWMADLSRSPNTQVFSLNLPDLSSPEYGRYRFVFEKPESGSRFSKEKVRRFEGFVNVLNQYIMAFNSMTAAEMQSRFSHRLFAHQSKEPLLSMRYQFRVLQDQHFLDKDGSITREYYGRMEKLVEQMLTRSNYILNVRKKFGHEPPLPSNFNIKTMTAEVVKNMRKTLDDSPYKGEILIETKGEKEPDIEIYSDETKIREILEQLIGNSIKYCRDTRQIRLGVRFDKENVYFKVADNGVGIPENELPYIFTAYYRGEHGETYNIDGDGLGLWAAKSYAEILGGEINAKNNQDSSGKPSGITFTLSVPRQFRPLKKENEEVKHEPR